MPPSLGRVAVGFILLIGPEIGPAVDFGGRFLPNCPAVVSRRSSSGHALYCQSEKLLSASARLGRRNGADLPSHIRDQEPEVAEPRLAPPLGGPDQAASALLAGPQRDLS